MNARMEEYLGRPAAAYRPRPLGELLDLQASRNRDAPAFSCDGVTITRAELARCVNRRARALERLGVVREDFVVIALPNGSAFMETAFACWILGATPAPVSHRLPAPEFRAIVELIRPKVIIGDDTARLIDPAVVHHVMLDDLQLSGDPLSVRTSGFQKAIATGGSTGRPKVIVDHTPGIIDPDLPPLGMRPNDVVVLPGPLYHSAPFGVATAALACGCHLVVMPRFDPRDTLALVEQHRGNWLYQVPTMMHRIWTMPPAERLAYDVSSLAVVCHIAAACPIWLKSRWIEWLGAEKIWEIYAGSEAFGATIIGGSEWLTHRGSVGRVVLGGGEIRILDGDGNAVANGEIGEIYFRVQALTANYHYIGAEARSRGAWQSFGDLGWLDEDGYLYIADRRTDLIIVGGVNVYPAEIEAALEAYPGVVACVVVGLSDADMGHRVHAIIETSAGSGPPDEDAIRQFLRDRLVPIKIPKSIEITHERLRDDAGKVRRGALRDARLGAAHVER